MDRLNVGLTERELRRISTMREHARDMPVKEAGIAFFDRGKPTLKSLKLSGRNLVLTRMSVFQSFAAYTVPDAAWLCLHIPLCWREEYLFDGRAMSLGEAILTSSPNGYFTKGRDRDALTIGLRKKSLCAAISAISGRPYEGLEFRHFVFRPNRQFLRAIAQQFLESQTEVLAARPEAANRCIEPSAETHIFDMLALEWINNDGSHKSSRDKSKRASDVVGQALTFSSANEGFVPSLSQLCAATGVGQTRLFECFQEVQGMAPYTYFQAMRLDAAYHQLNDVERPPHSVKQVALALGFTKPSRFAERFCHQYGELPSSVLARTLRAKAPY